MIIINSEYHNKIKVMPQIFKQIPTVKKYKKKIYAAGKSYAGTVDVAERNLNFLVTKTDRFSTVAQCRLVFLFFVDHINDEIST